MRIGVDCSPGRHHADRLCKSISVIRTPRNVFPVPGANIKKNLMLITQ